MLNIVFSHTYAQLHVRRIVTIYCIHFFLYLFIIIITHYRYTTRNAHLSRGRSCTGLTFLFFSFFSFLKLLIITCPYGQRENSVVCFIVWLLAKKRRYSRRQDGTIMRKGYEKKNKNLQWVRVARTKYHFM